MGGKHLKTFVARVSRGVHTLLCRLFAALLDTLRAPRPLAGALRPPLAPLHSPALPL